MSDRSRPIALLAASALLLAGVLLSGLPASASPPALPEPRYDQVSSITLAAPSEVGVQATVTQTAVVLALELLLSPVYYHVDLPFVVANGR
jgi:hypothetical protein